MIFVIGISLGIGVFLVFFTNLGGEINWTSNVSLDFLLFGIFGFHSINFNLGLSFMFFWLIYLICYLFCLLKPVPFAQFTLFRTRRDQASSNTKISDNGGFGSPHNYLMITISWFSLYFILSILIDVIQKLFGITLGNPLMHDPLLSFFLFVSSTTE